uniref:RUN and SH3 domain containing 1 n=1 Tax=Xenopus tropicalis TaxID=8364 RepID=A0A803JLD5_XENTR
MGGRGRGLRVGAEPPSCFHAQAQLGDSRLSPELGYLLLGGLCPSLYSLLGDGLKPFQKDVIVGRRRLSPWSLVEGSVRAGAGPLHSLLGNVSRLSELRDPQRRFNAFIFGLLNTKQLDLWISLLHESYAACTSSLFAPWGFLPLAATTHPASCSPCSASPATFIMWTAFEARTTTLHRGTNPQRTHYGTRGPSCTPPPGGFSAGYSQLGGLAATTDWHPVPQKDACPTSPPKSCGQAPSPDFTPRGSWWGHLSKASRSYLPPTRETASHWNKLANWGGRGEEAEGSSSWGQKAPDIIAPVPNAPPTGQMEAPTPSGEGWGSGGAAEQQNEPHIVPNTEDWSNWLGHLFGAKPSPTQGKKKSRLPSDWLTPPVRVLDLIGLPSPSEKAQRVGPVPEERKEESRPERSVRAMCDHRGSDRAQLSFRKGEVLELVGTVDEDWIRCRRGNESGLVPVCYTSLIL